MSERRRAFVALGTARRVAAAAGALLVLQLGAASVAAPAERPEPFRVELQNRTFTPPPGIDRDAIAAGRDPGGERVHFFAQLEELPTVAERAGLETGGLRLLAYVDGNTYVASSAVRDVDRLGSVGAVRWAGLILPGDKISPALAAGRIGDWARTKNGRVVLTIQVHADVSIATAEAVAERHGGEVVDRVSLLPAVTAIFPPGRAKLLAQEDAVLYVDVAERRLEPENDKARTAANVDPLALPPYNLTGAGVTALVYDVGVVDTHPDFGARVVQRQTTPAPPTGLHATHVAGAVAGSGANSTGVRSDGVPNNGEKPNQWAGAAPGASIRSFGFDGGDLYANPGDLQQDFTTAIGAGIDLANMSLGRNPDPEVPADCDLLGQYPLTAQLMDNIVRGSIAGQQLIFTKSAGNSGIFPHCPGYSTITPPATAKNPIVIGSINSDDGSLSVFSSRGPTEDGRLKPDVMGPGCHATPATWVENSSPGFIDLDPPGPENPNLLLDPGEPQNGYAKMCGTSMASPIVAGVTALVLEQWRLSKGAATPLPAHTAKAILVQGATDQGLAGPDFQFGFGSVDAKASVDLIRGDGTTAAIQVDQVDQGATDHYTFVSDGTRRLKATLVWSDPAATPLAAKTLVNDLDLRVTAPDGTVYSPFVLNPAIPGAVATTGVDRRNNVELVLGNAQAGTWTLAIEGHTVPTGPQSYSLVVSNEPAPPGLVACDIIWTGGGGTGAWGTAANWLPVRVPGAGDYVCIPDMTPNVTVVHSSGTTSIDGLASFERVELSGGTLALTDVAAPSFVREFTLSSGGVLGGAGTLTVLVDLDWMDGRMTDGGTTSVARGASLTVDAGAFGNVQLDGGRRLVVAGSASWQAGTIVGGDGAVVQVVGSFALAGNNPFSWSGLGARPLVHVLPSGVLSKTLPGGGTSIVNAAVENDGTVSVGSGVLDLSGGGGPGTDRGTFTAAGGATLELGAGDRELAAAGVVGGLGTVRVSGGNVDVLGTWDVAGTTSVTGGTLEAGADMESAQLTLSGGIVSGAANVLVTGTLTWTGGRMTDGGETIVPVGGNLLINTPAFGSVQLDGGRRLRVLGTGTWQNGTINAGDAAFAEVAGTLSITGSNALNWSGLGDRPLLHVTAAGTVTKSGSGGTTTLASFVDNDGLLRATAGTLSLTGGDGGAVQVGRFGGSTPTSLVRFDTGTYTLGGGARFDGRVTIDGATVAVTGPVGSDAGTTTTLTQGTLTGGGTLTVSGTLVWTAGRMTDSGTTRVAPGGSLSINTAPFGAVQLDGGRTLEIAGTATWQNGNINAADAALVAISGSLALAGNNVLNWTGLGARPRVRVNAGGTLAKVLPGAGTSTLEAAVENDGTTSVASGVLSLSGGGGPGPNNGAFTAAAGTTLQFAVGDHEVGPGATVGGAGTTEVSGGGVAVSGSWNVPGTTRVTGGTLALNAPASSTLLALAGGTVSGSSTLTVPGTLTWTGGRMTDVGITRTPAGATLLVNTPAFGSVQLDGGRRVEILGTANWQNGSITGGDAARFDVTGTFNVTGNNNFNWTGLGARPLIRVLAGGLLAKIAPGGGTTNISATVENGGTLRVASGTLDLEGPLANYSTADDALTGGVYHLLAPLRLTGAEIKTNAATIVLDGPGAEILDLAGANGLRSFALNAAGGQLTLANGKDLSLNGPPGGTFENAGLIRLGAASDFKSGATFVNRPTGRLVGTGAVTQYVVNEGTIEPGASPGTLQITGSFQQGPTGVLVVELAGTGAGTFDRLQVLGAGGAQLHGTLRILTAPGFTPALGTNFQVLTFASLAGSFATLENTNAGGGHTYFARYGTGDVRVAVGEPPTFADVSPSNSFYEHIEKLFDLGITTGCGTNAGGALIFCPTDPVPREQMAAFLVRAKGLTQLFPGTPTFADVPASNQFFGYIERLFQQGITTGCGTNGAGALVFCPADHVPRQQMAAFLIRAKGLTQLVSPTPTFADVPASNPFYGWIERLFQTGITTGCGRNSVGALIYCPLDSVPRQQMAAFLVRAFAP